MILKVLVANETRVRCPYIMGNISNCMDFELPNCYLEVQYICSKLAKHPLIGETRRAGSYVVMYIIIWLVYIISSRVYIYICIYIYNIHIYIYIYLFIFIFKTHLSGNSTILIYEHSWPGAIRPCFSDRQAAPTSPGGTGVQAAVCCGNRGTTWDLGGRSPT